MVITRREKLPEGEPERRRRPSAALPVAAADVTAAPAPGPAASSAAPSAVSSSPTSSLAAVPGAAETSPETPNDHSPSTPVAPYRSVGAGLGLVPRRIAEREATRRTTPPVAPAPSPTPTPTTPAPTAAPAPGQAPRGFAEVDPPRSTASEATTPAPPTPAPEKPLSVGELVTRIKDHLQSAFRVAILVQGEASNVRRPRAGHLYFTLKDRRAQLRVVVFAANVALMPVPIEDGAQVVVRGNVTAYVEAGDLQLVADRVEPVGWGERARALEALKRRLQAEGLFDAARKRPLPRFPRTIGLVTSPTGAAIRDVLSAIDRRFPNVRVVLSSVRTTGTMAAAEVAAALAALDRHVRCDVVIVVRGGGSKEELEAFDDERVVRAIVASRAPVVTGIGHETDVSLADLAADVRAATPTAAAELVVPEVKTLERELRERAQRLAQALRGRVELAKRRLDACARSFGFRAPQENVARQRARLETIEARLARVAAEVVRVRAARLDSAGKRLRAPVELVRRSDARLGELESRLDSAVRASLERRHVALASVAAGLDRLSPLKVLARGFSLTTRAGTTEVVRDARALAWGDELDTRLARGRVRSKVVGVDLETDLNPNRPIEEGPRP